MPKLYIWQVNCFDGDGVLTYTGIIRAETQESADTLLESNVRENGWFDSDGTYEWALQAVPEGEFFVADAEFGTSYINDDEEENDGSA